MAKEADKAETASRAGEFAQQAQAGHSGGIIREFIGFMRANKKWWLAPILIGLLGIGILVVVGGSAAAPFIYTLF
jgi:hypothetical protein